MTTKTRSKYGNTRVVADDGQVFHSKKEKARYDVLKKMEEKGEIWNLRRQVRYTLLPPVFETKQIRLKTMIKEKVTQLYRETTYAADFVYMKDGVEIVEDVKASKAFQDPLYKLKKKLMYMMHNITIKEIY